MKQCDNEDSSRTLDMHMLPVLSWYRKFQKVKIKMEESIRNICKTLMAAQLTHLHVYSYFMSNFCFGCGIMDMTDAQDKELRRTYEKRLARKLGSGRKFPRKMLCGGVTAMGVKIVAPKTEISALTLKLCFSHKRMNSENEKKTDNNRK